jgi:hypothetical protein
MPLIYKDFADGFNDINHTVVSDRMTLVSGHRAYMARGKPYFDYVHFPKVSESWATHERLQSHYRSNTNLHHRVWAGAAGEMNLSYMAVTKAPAAILYDINPFQALFWQGFFRLLADCPDADMFALEARQFLKDFYFSLRDQFNLEAIQKEYDGPPKSYGRGTEIGFLSATENNGLNSGRMISSFGT